MNAHKHRFYLLFISLIITCSCQQGAAISVIEQPVTAQERTNEANGIQLVLESDEFETSPSSISTTIINKADATCSYGEFFRMEQKIDGLWYRVKYPERVFNEFPTFIDIGYVLQPNHKVVQNFSLNRLDMVLPEGHYRLVKTVLCPSPQGKEITVSG